MMKKTYSHSKLFFSILFLFLSIESTNMFILMNRLEASGRNNYPKRIRHPFTPEEDELLKQLVEQQGEDWNRVASEMKGRNIRQCRERWTYYLDPNINKEPWTDEEDRKLLKLQSEQGNKWKSFSSHFNGRSIYNIKNRYLILQRKEKRKYKKGKNKTTTVNANNIGTNGGEDIRNVTLSTNYFMNNNINYDYDDVDWNNLFDWSLE